MTTKLRINVVCSSRDKRFLVLAEKEWPVSMFGKSAEDIFHRLYPDEPKLEISSIQNEFHFDIPLNYKVEEVMVDSGLVFVEERKSSYLYIMSQLISEEPTSKTNTSDQELLNSPDSRQYPATKKTKAVRKKSRSVKIQTRKCNHGKGIGEGNSSNTVTSTTSPSQADQATSLMPQVIQRISEDSEVDIESVDDSATPSWPAPLSKTEVKGRANGKKASQQLLRRARKVKRNGQKSTQLVPTRIHNL
ncbi:uncharacterized protein [Montipora foliosa]|uniref:uncharacterized protein isoform X1 n=2 Tax=Montipora foliosa TaxID=591990 RepID=UPI0035F10CDE